MLQNIGDKLQSHKWLTYSVMGLLALIFAVWGVDGLISLTGNSTAVAKVNGQNISAEEVNRAWQEQQPRYLQLFGGQIDDAQRRLLQEQLVDGFVRNAAVTQRSDELGFRVSRAQILQAFRDEPAFQIDGKFDRNAAYARLASAGVSPAAYEADVRRRLLVNQLGNAIGATEFLTASEAKRLVALETEEREVRYLRVGAESFASGPAFDAAAIEAAYKADEAQYMQPESARLAYAELTLADVAAQLTVTDEKLREAYEKDKDRFQIAETRQARHILLPVEGGQNDAAVKAQAEALLARAKGGEDFAKLARENSKDSGSAGSGGDLGWADQTIYEPAFGEALFALKDGELSAPVKTRFGWHLIKLEGIRPGHSQSFDEARPELESQLRQQLAADEFGTRQEQLQQRLERGGSGLDELVRDFGLRRGSIEDFQRGAGGAPLGSDAGLNEVVFSDRVANQGAVGGPVALGDDRLVVVKVEEHRPAKLKPLDEVRAQVVAKLTRERGTEAARKAADEALKRLQGGEPLDKIAAGLKLKAEPAKFVGRAAPDLPVEIRDAVFAAPRPVAGQPLRQLVRLDDGAALVEVLGTRVPDGEVATLLGSQLAQRELQRQGGISVDAYLAEVMRKAKVTRNLDLLQ